MKTLLLGAFICSFSLNSVYNCYQESKVSFLIEFSKDNIKDTVKCLKYNQEKKRGHLCKTNTGTTAKLDFRNFDIIKVSEIKH